MSQPDLLDELRAARPIAPHELRERVRAVAGAAPSAPRSRFTWRRASIALVPAVAALVVAALVLGHDRATTTEAKRGGSAAEGSGAVATETTVAQGSASSAATPAPFGIETVPAVRDQQTLQAPNAPAPPPGRVVRYSASLELRLRTPDAVGRAAQRALRISRALGGFPTTVNIDARGRQGNASLVLRIPRAHVQQAIERLSSLGTIVGENVSLQDLQAGLNATDRTIARLQTRLRDLRAQEQTAETTRAIAAATARIERLQRGSAGTRRGAHYATIALQLHTPHAVHRPARDGHGPLHGLGVAFRWIGIGAIYALALGGPLVVLALLGWLVLRIVRRRREDALLARP